MPDSQFLNHMEPPPPIIGSQPETVRPPTMSLAARLLNVFAVPGDVFDGVKLSAPSAANWLTPALLLVVIGWVGAWLIFSQPTIQQQIREMNDRTIQKLVDKGRLTEPQAEQQRHAMEVGAKFTPYVAPVFTAFITPFGWGLILWLAGTRALKGNFPYMKAVEVAGLASAVTVLESVVRTLLIVGSSNLFTSPSLALLVKDFDPQKPLHSLLTVASPMMFWLLAVRSIGLARLSGASFIKAAVWVFGIWAAYTALLTGIGLAIQAAFGG